MVNHVLLYIYKQDTVVRIIGILDQPISLWQLYQSK